MRSSISISARVDVDDVLYEIDKEQLVAAVEQHGYIVTKRGKPIPLPPDDLLSEIQEAIEDRRYNDAITLIERTRFPKWNDPKVCLKDYERLRAALTTTEGR